MTRGNTINSHGEPMPDARVNEPELPSGPAGLETLKAQRAVTAMDQEDLQNQRLMQFQAQADSEPKGRPEPSGETGQPLRRPFEDASDLNSIPGVRPEDPPYRHWWVNEDEDDKSKN